MEIPQPMINSVAQTNIQLFNQLSRSGYSTSDLTLVYKAYYLATELFPGYLHGNGKVFIANLLGTASILGSVGAPAELIAAGLLHAVYPRGDFGDGTRGISDSKRKQIRESVGEKVEKYVARYTTFRWKIDTLADIKQNLNNFDSFNRNVVLLRLADDLEGHLDMGVLYRTERAERTTKSKYVNGNDKLIIQIAVDLGYDSLANQLELAYQEETLANVYPELRSQSNGGKWLLPKSYQRLAPEQNIEKNVTTFDSAKGNLSSFFQNLISFIDIRIKYFGKHPQEIFPALVRKTRHLFH